MFRHAEQGVYEFGAAVSAKRFGKYFRDWWVQAVPEHPEVTLHGLRHFCASQLINEVRLSIPEVAAWLGDTETTVLKTYVHVSDDRYLDRAASGMTFRSA